MTDTAIAPLVSEAFRQLTEAPRLTFACAESCTGGLVAYSLTRLAGASDVFLGSAVTYSNEAKTALLGVPEEVLRSVGAVSEECARAMAEGACRVFASSLAVSTTGIAGPSGGTERKPVGLVYLAVASARGTRAVERRFLGSRVEIIEAATAEAYRLVLDETAALRNQQGFTDEPS